MLFCSKREGESTKRNPTVELMTLENRSVKEDKRNPQNQIYCELKMIKKMRPGNSYKII